MISSFHRESDALQYFHDARNLFSSAGMNLKSWTSNSDSLKETARSEGALDSEPVNKILRLRWKPATDTLSLAARDFPFLMDVTKRLILKYSSQIYDPLGLLSPATIQVKLLLRDLWKLRYDWAVPLPADFQEIWIQIARDLRSITAVIFSR